MKLDEVTISKFSEYTDDEVKNAINQFKNNGKPIIQVEGGKFTLIKNKDWYGIQRNSDKNILGWASIEDAGKYFKIKMFYILPKYRKRSAAAVILFWAIKEMINKPLLLDDVISYGTNDLLTNLSKKKKQGITPRYINKKTGEDTNDKSFFDKDPNNFNVILEQVSASGTMATGLVGWPIPGQNQKNLLSYKNGQCFTWFDHVHDVLEG